VNRFDLWRTLAISLLASIIWTCSRDQSVSHDANSPLHIDETKLKSGDVIRPFAYIDPEKHDWKVEIRISGEDLLDIDASRKMTSRKFSTTKTEVLGKIAGWEFVYGKKSTHRPTSTLRVYRDNQLVEKHGIVIERHHLGFQSVKYGMLSPVDENAMFQTIDQMSHF
jgi:hypothetical protein